MKSKKNIEAAFQKARRLNLLSVSPLVKTKNRAEVYTNVGSTRAQTTANYNLFRHISQSGSVYSNPY